MNTMQPVVIFSCDLWSNDERGNREASFTADMLLEQEGIEYRNAQGCCDGIKELSYVVADTIVDASTVRAIAFDALEQESIFCIDANSNCYLEYADGRCDRLGKLRVVQDGDPLPDNYTVLDGVTYTAGE